MKTMKVVLKIACLVIIASNTFLVAAANNLPGEPWPDCGIHIIDNVVPNNYGGNLAVVGVVLQPGDFYSYDMTSYNGWEIIEVYFWVSSGPNIFYIYPPGTQEVLIELPGSTVSTSVSLERNCSARPQCKPTGRFVYTLFGNYVCNLISEEASIPARFLNPEYSAPLCELPNLSHIWNGDWVKNKEQNCGDYFRGGNHYDTRLPGL